MLNMKPVKKKLNVKHMSNTNGDHTLMSMVINDFWQVNFMKDTLLINTTRVFMLACGQ